MSAGAKDALRASMKQVLASMSPAERDERSAAVCANIAESAWFVGARCVLVYASIPGEVGLDGLMRSALASGKRVGVPRVDWAGGTMTPMAVSNLDSELVAGRYGVRSPVAGCPEIPVSELDLVLVPGLAFDAGGRRLGRGAGFYDRMLEGVCCPAVGVCFASQIVGCVPTEAHDRVMDRVVCETGELRREHG